MSSLLRIADRTFTSRLFTGTGKYASAAALRAVLDASGAEVVTVAVKRVRFGAQDDGILSALDPKKHLILPNTSGVRTAKEAIFAAELAREALGTSWLKLEIHPDPKYLGKRPLQLQKNLFQLVDPQY